jgi:sporulation integral membrane protein YtvI
VVKAAAWLYLAGGLIMPDPDRIQRDKATILAIIKYILIAAVVAAVIYFGLRLFWILLPFVFGFVLAQVANLLASAIFNMLFKIRHRPARDAANAQASGRKKRGIYPHGLARSRKETRLAIVLYFIEVIALISLVIVIINGGVSQLRALASYLPDIIKNANLSGQIITYIKNLSDKLGVIFHADFLAEIEKALTQTQQQAVQALPGIAAKILNALASFVGSVPMIIFVIIVVIMSGYYFTADKRFLYVFMHRNITSKPFREKSIRLVSNLSTTLFRVIGGYVLLFVITFVMALGGLLIIRMPYPVIFALVLAIVDLLPVFGIGATLVPIAIYMFFRGSIFGGIGALVLLVAMVLIRRVIEPPILGTALRLHPMATLASMIIGIGIYGLGGIIVGPIIFVIAREIMVLYGFDQKIRAFVGTVLNKVSS